MQPPSRYKELASAIYDRCPLQAAEDQPPRSPYSSGSHVELAPRVAVSMDLRLSSAGGPNVLDHSSVVHVGYSWQPGSHWLCSAITDDLGCHSRTASYYIPQWRNDWRVFRHVMQDIVICAGELIGAGRSIFSVIVAKESRMLEQEIKGTSSWCGAHAAS